VADGVQGSVFIWGRRARSDAPYLRVSGGWIVVGGGEAEDIVDVADEGAALAIGEFAMGVEIGQESSPSRGGLIAVLSETQGFASEPGKGVEQASVIGGIVVELAFAERAEDLGDGNTEDDLVETGFVVAGKEAGGGFVFEVHLGTQSFILKPILEAALSPVGDVLVVEGNAAPGEGLNDDGTGCAISEHLIELVAQFFGEFGNFTVSGMCTGLEVEDFGLGQRVWLGGR